MGNKASVPKFPLGAATDLQQQQQFQVMRIGHEADKIRTGFPEQERVKELAQSLFRERS